MMTEPHTILQDVYVYHSLKGEPKHFNFAIYAPIVLVTFLLSCQNTMTKAMWLGTGYQRGILILLPLRLDDDHRLTLSSSQNSPVWLPRLYFLPGYWPISIILKYK